MKYITSLKRYVYSDWFLYKEWIEQGTLGKRFVQQTELHGTAEQRRE